MYLHCFNRVVDSISLKYLSGREVNESSKQPDDQCRVDIDVVTHSSDHHQTSQGGVHDCETEVLVGLLLPELVEEKVGDECRHTGGQDADHDCVLGRLDVT
jgi:hypothetical protein